jgi:hypothetical protein
VNTTKHWLAGLALIGATFAAAPASAAVIGGPAAVGTSTAAPVETVQYYDGYGRPHYRRPFYGRPYYGPRRFYGGPRYYRRGFYGGPRVYRYGY